MCGIAGYFTRNRDFNPMELSKMTATLAHRGPEAEGFFSDDLVGLGHRRLKIIDLSESANQPMNSHCDRYVMVFNGEVYNYKEIAKELKVNLKTSSDTEVILEAFVQWGTNFVHRLNGMFAIAIYDKQEKKLYLFRDRLGIKPIYYFWDGIHFVFASELKAITAIEFVKKNLTISKQAISNYLYLGYIPQSLSIYDNIFKFPSGNFAILNDKSFELTTYWDPATIISSSLVTDEKTAIQELDKLLNQSVNYRMISDVPFGTFLSGGIDSSLVTAIAQKNSSSPINTFSIGFKESKYNEVEYARKIAGYLKTNHHEFMVSYDDAIELIPSILDSYDEPFSDSSAIPTMLVSKLAKQHVTMTLSGDGGDELFHGYGAYNWANRLSNPIFKIGRKPISWALSVKDNRSKRAAMVFNYPNKSTLKSHIFSQEQYLFTQKEISQLLKPSMRTTPNINEEIGILKRKLTPSEEQAYFDINYYLKDDLLVKVDRATMKYSLETRVPLLDYRIVEFALNLSPDLKIKDGVQKYLLKKVLYNYIPFEYFDRPKWGFSIPLKDWLKSDLYFLIKEYLSHKIIKKHGVVELTYVDDLLMRFLKGEDYLYNRIWLLIVLHQWLERSVQP